ncbi:hypothetical protein V8E52_000851 [Russula decolorans]
MVVGTRKSNATKHPGDLLKITSQLRRTRAQIKEDNARVEAAAISAKEDAIANHQAIVDHVIDIEEFTGRDEEVIRAYANRPDLRNSSKYPVAASKKTTNLEHDSDVEDELEIEDSALDDSDSEGETTPPGSTNTGTTKTASDQDYRFDEDLSSTTSDGEEEEQTDSGSTIRKKRESKTRKAGRKKKAKPKRGDFRKEVNAALSACRAATGTISKSLVLPVARDSSLKRTISGRTSPQTLANAAPGPKCLKRSNAFHEGLLRDWRASLMKHIEDGEDNEGPHGPGEFDQDEPEEVLQKVMASKSSGHQVQVSAGSGSGSLSRSATPAISQWGASGGPLVTQKTDQMGVQITQVNSTTNDSDATANRKNGRKQKYTTLDLPYPPGGKNSENWKLLNAKVISWAGAQEDPFGTNGRLDTDIDTLWESVFPGSALDVQGQKCALVVCGNSLNNWRSDIGKAGHQAVLSMLYASRKYPHDKAGCKKLISDALYNLHFVYEKPDDESDRGPFCSAFVSKVYAVHLQKVPIHSNHGLQIGGLALATAAVERGLGLFKMGEDALELKEDKEPHCSKERSRNVRSQDLAFSEIPWGGAAREFMLPIKKLDESHWVSIYTHAGKFMGRSEQVVDHGGHFLADGSNEANCPRTRIQIDW